MKYILYGIFWRVKGSRICHSHSNGPTYLPRQMSCNAKISFLFVELQTISLVFLRGEISMCSRPHLNTCLNITSQKTMFSLVQAAVEFRLAG